MQSPDPSSRAILVVSHPGHELRVYEWLRQMRPTVFVLTDGSGHTGVSRLAATTRLLQGIGAQKGRIYGRFTDSQFYATLLAYDFAPFIALAKELASVFVTDQVHYVVADAAEGYNPAHDVCRLLVDTAVRLTHERCPNGDLRAEETTAAAYLREVAPTVKIGQHLQEEHRQLVAQCTHLQATTREL